MPHSEPDMDAMGGPMMDQPGLVGPDAGMPDMDGAGGPEEQGPDGGDVELDPKKDIQKLAGELSQKLRLYNDENNDPELSKYVAGMILTQAGKNMNGSDKKDVVKKMNGAEEEMEDMAENGPEGGQEDQVAEPAPQMESRKLSDRITETFNSMIFDKREKKRPSKEIKNNGVDDNNPFIYGR